MESPNACYISRHGGFRYPYPALVLLTVCVRSDVHVDDGVKARDSNRPIYLRKRIDCLFTATVVG